MTAQRKLADALTAAFEERFGNQARLGTDISADDLLDVIHEVLAPPSGPQIIVTRDPKDATRLHVQTYMSRELCEFFGIEQPKE